MENNEIIRDDETNKAPKMPPKGFKDKLKNFASGVWNVVKDNAQLLSLIGPALAVLITSAVLVVNGDADRALNLALASVAATILAGCGLGIMEKISDSRRTGKVFDVIQSVIVGAGVAALLNILINLGVFGVKSIVENNEEDQKAIELGLTEEQVKAMRKDGDFGKVFDSLRTGDNTFELLDELELERQNKFNLVLDLREHLK